MRLYQEELEHTSDRWLCKSEESAKDIEGINKAVKSFNFFYDTVKEIA